MMSDFSWLPGWALGCLAVVAALFALALLCMPFAVFGTKPRLQDLEFQIAEMRAELRTLSLRLVVSNRPDSAPVSLDGPGVAGPVSRSDPLSGARAMRPSSVHTDEDYLIPPQTLRSDLPSYEDGPGDSDPDSLPRRRNAPPVTGRRDMSGSAERNWSRAPWEQDAPQQQHASGSQLDRQPMGRGLERKQSGRVVADDTSWQARAEPKLRWPPRT